MGEQTAADIVSPPPDYNPRHDVLSLPDTDYASPAARRAARAGALSLEVIEQLSPAKDVRDVLRSLLGIYPKWFGNAPLFMLLLSDEEGVSWSAISFESPLSEPWGGVQIHQVDGGLDMDALVARYGTNVNTQVGSDGELQHLIERGRSFLLEKGAVTERYLGSLEKMSGLSLHTVLGAPWQRTLGGSGIIILGYPEKINLPDDALDLLATATRVSARMAFYPSLISYLQAKEKMNDSLRRNIVHDLKTPLTVIKGAAETLKQAGEDLDPSVRQEFRGQIVEESERLLEDLKDLINPLSDWDPHKERFDIARTLEKAVRAEQRTERSKAHKIEIMGTDEPLFVTADQRKIRRVIDNLLSNAIKYSPGEGKKVVIRLEQRNDEVLISFRDQGIGMDKKQLAKVMKSTGRMVDKSLGIEGSGFGLDSCRTILESHGGRLLATSTPGSGSTFTLSIPADPQD